MEPDTILLNITGSLNTWDTRSVCQPDHTYTAPKLVKGAPHTMPLRRLDDAKAARELDMARKPAI